MILRRLSSILLAAGLTAGALIMAAAPAQAAAVITDNGNGSATVSGVSGGFNFVYFCPSALSQSACWNSGSPQATYFVDNGSQNQTYWAGASVETFPGGVATSLPAGSYRILTNNGPSVDTSAVVTLTADPGGSSSASSSAATGPSPVVQQFGKPASGTCDTAQPEGLNWAGVSSGGWGESWAQWVNGGAGGAVCTRTLAFASSSSWVVR